MADTPEVVGGVVCKEPSSHRVRSDLISVRTPRRYFASCSAMDCHGLEKRRGRFGTPTGLRPSMCDPFSHHGHLGGVRVIVPRRLQM